ncbi:ABC transporter ATP-binding protein [Natronincola ferrireducens]|uniref:Peptide/nickel transport system ATP-binding protein n=1 Tax=Natronincola ferrireducens TaxID=393762 RepID=A0A1G9E4F6_9FIRM|nr:ABC transporter ATP-binding protein [Natronincola ferrireducens]SDK71001.1 peptide/nickel transport system ATP-binding protein [Natronincola ferrireducens]
MSKEIIKVNNLKTYFYLSTGIVKAVDGVSFRINEGETLGIVGESGSGKSVTASSIMRLVANPIGRIVDGEILFEGKDLLKLKEKEMLSIRGKEISMIFQDPMTSLDPVFTIGQQIMEVIKIHQNVSDKEVKKIAVEALNMVGIPEAEKRLNSYPHEFSGGMRQRVIIAMAIVCKPKMIIADEPTTALDVTVQAQVLDLLKDLQRQLGTSILMITHNLGVVWDICDKVMVMYAGKTVEYADARTLYSNPRHPYTLGLLNSMPKLSDDPDKPLTVIPGGPPDLKLTGNACNFYNRCAYAQDICQEKDPQLLEVNENHFVACHFQTETKSLKIKGEKV